MEDITLLSNNAYLIPWFFVTYEALKGDAHQVNSCADQPARATRLGALAAKFDVVLLQEVWGAASNNLVAKIDRTHNVLERNKVWHGVLGSGYFADWVNAYYHHLYYKNGGLFTAARKDIKVLWERHHNYDCRVGEEAFFKSVSFVLLDMGAKWKGKYLLTINTHLWSPKPFKSSEERRKQRKEALVHIINLQSEETFPSDFAWKNCGVVFVGDFNTAHLASEGTPTEEYVETVSTSFGVKLRDLFLETHPGSTQRSYDHETNKYVSYKTDSSRMDYIFLLDQIPSAEGPVDVMKLTGKCDIFVTAPGEDISDHYAVTATLRPANE